jgi:HAD superfamily phosphatase (TIGR01668 family)
VELLTFPVAWLIAAFYWIKFGGELPYMMVDTYRDIDYAKLKSQGVKGILFDKDRCLVPHNVSETNMDLKLFFGWLQKSFFTAIVSNNGSENLRAFAFQLGCTLIQAWKGIIGRKPGKRIYRKGVETLGLEPREVVMVGDKLFFDALGGQRAGLFGGILVNPVGTTDLPLDRLFYRRAEDIYLGWYGLKRPERQEAQARPSA